MSISQLWKECRNHRNTFYYCELSDWPIAGIECYYSRLPLSQSSGTSALANMMSERFIVTSPLMRMEGVENIGIQQMRSQLRCVKCSEDLSSCLPPLGFLRTFPHPPPKPLVYLTCKHIIHYNCIDNPQKLCPICPSTDEDTDVDEDVNMDENEVEDGD